jgi:hypothetical protein
LGAWPNEKEPKENVYQSKRKGKRKSIQFFKRKRKNAWHARA